MDTSTAHLIASSTSQLLVETTYTNTVLLVFIFIYVIDFIRRVITPKAW